MSEVFLRNDSAVADVDVRQRLIDVIAVPWDQEAEVEWRGEIWNEIFRRGAFDGLEDHVGRVRVNREHVIGNTVGKLVWADPASDLGLITRAKIAKTQAGDDTLGLAEDGAVSGSVGYRIKDPADVDLNRRTKLREVMRAFLDHLSFVESPAFVGAEVLAVRDSRMDDILAPTIARTLTDAWNHPAYVAAVERLNRSRAGAE